MPYRQLVKQLGLLPETETQQGCIHYVNVQASVHYYVEIFYSKTLDAMGIGKYLKTMSPEHLLFIHAYILIEDSRCELTYQGKRLFKISDPIPIITAAYSRERNTIIRKRLELAKLLNKHGKEIEAFIRNSKLQVGEPNYKQLLGGLMLAGKPCTSRNFQNVPQSPCMYWAFD